MNIICRSFDELTPTMLYDLIQLRIAVFVLEQDCLYQELDNKDQHANHILIYDNKQLVGYARVLYDEEKQAVSFGRLASHPKARGNGIGKMLMDEIMLFFKQHHPDKKYVISAQCYVTEFYQRYGFNPEGETYLEDGLPHILMIHHGFK